MGFKIVKWYGERKTVTQVSNFEDAYIEYINSIDSCSVQVYYVNGEQCILLAQKED